MMILGLDQAPRHIGYSWGESKFGTVPKWGVTDFSSYGAATGFLIRDIRKWLTNLCKSIIPEVVYYESFFNNGNNVTFFEQCIVASLVEVVAEDIGAACHVVQVDKWRKRQLGSSNRPKWTPANNENWFKEAAVKACADRNWLIDPKQHHAAEASLIWDYGCAHADNGYRAAVKSTIARIKSTRENLDREFNGKLS